MYNPAPFAEERIEVLHEFIRRNPLAVIVTGGAGGLEATHVPVIVHPEIGANGVLRCHFGRANGHWRSMESAAVLAVFQGPDHYISPSWYPSKEEHGKVVPTWNYVAVHVRGQGSVFEDRGELIEHVRTLTALNESVFEKPWSVGDAPEDYIAGLSKGIVGIEIAIESIEGKWKMSQNRPEPDRRGVVAGLVAERGLKGPA